MIFLTEKTNEMDEKWTIILRTYTINFFGTIEKKEMGCSRTMIERNAKKFIVPISSTRSKKNNKVNIFHHFELFYCVNIRNIFWGLLPFVFYMYAWTTTWWFKFVLFINNLLHTLQGTGEFRPQLRLCTLNRPRNIKRFSHTSPKKKKFLGLFLIHVLLIFDILKNKYYKFNLSNLNHLG